MIAQLKGTVSIISDRTIVIEVGGVGYEVFVTRDLAASLKVGQTVTMFTHFNVREDAQELYGFTKQEDLAFFKLLLTVSGIGPKSALNVLDVVKPDDIRRAVAAGDAAVLHKLHGLGKKTAERLVTELKDKLGQLTIAPNLGSDEAALLEAVTGLGYSLIEAREAVRVIAGQGKTLSEKIKLALKYLGRQ